MDENILRVAVVANNGDARRLIDEVERTESKHWFSNILLRVIVTGQSVRVYGYYDGVSTAEVDKMNKLCIQKDCERKA